MKNIVYVIVFVLFSLFATFAEAEKTNNKSSGSEYIPFIVQKPIMLGELASTNPKTLPLDQPRSDNFIQNTVIAINVNEIATIVKNLKNSICKSVGEADVKVALGVSANGKADGYIIGIDVNGQSSIEVTFHCNG